MKYLIVNADDFGASRGTNRGIVDAHRLGILTSASLLVDTPWSEEAAIMSRLVPTLSVGLHVDLKEELDRTSSPRRLRAALRAQVERFEDLVGREPTHLDSHHNVHRDRRLLPRFLDLAAERGWPLREHSPVRCFSKFYGQWAGETHPEQISVASLARMLETNIEDGITELSCHPGYDDPELVSSYAREREVELKTLCDPFLERVLAQHGIQLISYHDWDKAPAVESA